MTPQERNQKIVTYGAGYARLMETLADIPREMWQFKPSPTDWSVHEVIVHLADSETNSYLRFRLLLAEPGKPVMAYDQDVWATALNYHARSVDDSLAILDLVRKTTHAMLVSLPEEVWSNTVIHPEFDQPYSLEQWLDIYAAHIPGHIEQIKENYRIWLTRSLVG
jgi:hypothetical protein